LLQLNTRNNKIAKVLEKQQ